MNIADKLTTIAENEQKVYDAGYNLGDYNHGLQIWQNIFGHITDNLYQRVFQLLDFSNYEFVKPIAPKGNANCSLMFCSYKGEYLPKNLDFSGVSSSANITSIFSWATNLLEIPDIGLPAMNSYAEFVHAAYRLKKIEIMRVHKDTAFSNAFIYSGNMKLEEIYFEGEIGQNLNFGKCPNLIHNSLMNIIEHLYDYASEGSAETYTLTLGSTNLAKLSSDEIAIGEAKGWVIK